MKCICCGKEGHHFHRHYNGGYVCDNCIGSYFTCPSCGLLYDKDDLEHGDALVDGKCVACTKSEQ